MIFINIYFCLNYIKCSKKRNSFGCFFLFFPNFFRFEVILHTINKNSNHFIFRQEAIILFLVLNATNKNTAADLKADFLKRKAFWKVFQD